MMRGLVLYGPPGAGKSAVAAALHQLDPAFVEFPILKAGPGRHAGYRMTTLASIDERRDAGGIVWSHRRYGATYAIDGATLAQYLVDRVPVVQLGQVDAARAVVDAVTGARWVLLSLWCTRDVAEQRITARHTGDVAERLRAWDRTKELPTAHARIDTSSTTPEEVAATALQVIDRLMSEVPDVR